MTSREGQQSDLLDLAAPAERAGFRLHRLELLNWGTFDEKVWSLDARGETSLLTGDIGSGKSTIVDALTTLLIAPQRVAYNKAAGAEARERSARSYFLGHFKAERSETGTGARPVSLRSPNSYSVLLAHFFNEGYQQHVTLAQVFFMRDHEGQPSRVFVVADQQLTLTEHFSGFSDIAELRKRLRASGFEVDDSYPRYMGAFRKRFGIVNDQALELFHQTVSMKSVGNLTDFVRQHMLQPFPVDERIAKLIAHVDDLTRAHQAVLKAKDQLRRLTPLVEDCDTFDAVTARVNEERACRDALKAWFAAQRAELLRAGLEACQVELEAARVEIAEADKRRGRVNADRDGLKQDIAQNGGERMERLRQELERLGREEAARRQRAEAYDSSAAKAGLSPASDAQAFARNAREGLAVEAQLEETVGRLRTTSIEEGMRLAELKRQRDELAAEVTSLRQRKSNIPAEQVGVRLRLCQSVGIGEAELPFAGELMRVHQDDRAWEGAVERVLRGFGTSLLVPDEHYAGVARWVDQTQLGARLVYHRIKDGKPARTPTSQPASLSRKLEFKHDSPLASWVEGQVAQHFNPVCCDTVDEFRREPSALTRNGQLKGGVKHTKDDRSRVDDRTRYILGWSNLEKVAVLQEQLTAVEVRAHETASRIAGAHGEEQRLRVQLDALKAVAAYKVFEELDWRQLVLELRRVEAELATLEKSSDRLRALQKQLEVIDKELARADKALAAAREGEVRADERRGGLEKALARADAVLQATTDQERSRFARLAELTDLRGARSALTIDNGELVESELRAWLQGRLDADAKQLDRLGQRIVSAMQDYRNAYPVETREADAKIEAAGEFRRMLESVRSDDLPRFERKFKELLNENTINEVANFQSQLRRERQEISERIGLINKSLRDIEFNPGRFIRLESANAADAEVRDFQLDLKACTEGTLTGSGDEAYSELKFLQVKKLIDRFRGREGTTDLDQRWTQKVTDVRNWFAFSASERWLEGDREHEHYTDSGGKSGGQKEKLAYTVLAASLAYQFGLEWGASKSRSFRFVVIDEAFGRGSDDSATYGLELFRKLNLQLLVVTPLQKIHVIEPFVANVGFVSNPDGERSRLLNLSIEEFRARKAAREP